MSGRLGFTGAWGSKRGWGFIRRRSGGRPAVVSPLRGSTSFYRLPRPSGLGYARVERALSPLRGSDMEDIRSVLATVNTVSPGKKYAALRVAYVTQSPQHSC